MAVQTIETLKEKFKSGSFPTQQDYHDVFDSFLSKGESLTTDDIKGTGDSSELSLTQILASLDIPTVPEGLDEFIEKVNSFLEDTDVADETINKWKEIETFLTGITDTETLTGLLADLKAEILAEQLITTATELYCTNDPKIVVYNGVLQQTKKTKTYVQGTQGPLNRPHTYPVGTKVIVCDGKKYIYAGDFKMPMYVGDNGSLAAKTYYYIPVGYVIGDWMTSIIYRQGPNFNVISDTQKYYYPITEQNFSLYESEDGKFYFLYFYQYQNQAKYVLLQAFREQSFYMGNTSPIKEPLKFILIDSYSETTLEEEFSSNVGYGKFECSWVSEWGNVSLSESEVKKIVAENIPEQKEYTAGDGIEISEEGVISAVKEVSNKRFCEIIDDLDASDAPAGTIAMYGGPTNDKYTHGFIYEKGEGGDEYIEDIIPSSFSLSSGEGGVFKIATPIQTIDSVQVTNMGISPVVLNGKFYKYISEASGGSYDEYVFVCNEDTANIIGEHCLGKIIIITNGALLGPYEVEELIKEEAGASWTPLNVMNVIN